MFVPLFFNSLCKPALRPLICSKKFQNDPILLGKYSATIRIMQFFFIFYNTLACQSVYVFGNVLGLILSDLRVAAFDTQCPKNCKYSAYTNCEKLK